MNFVKETPQKKDNNNNNFYSTFSMLSGVLYRTVQRLIFYLEY